MRCADEGLTINPASYQAHTLKAQIYKNRGKL
jgi:hypothetical protein